MKITNSLSGKAESIEEMVPGRIGVYTCGPTVYDTATIGNFRTYFLSDVFVRAARYLGYEVNYVMNLTDVGHLTGDNQGDADTGEDRLEKGAKREGRNAWDIAKTYGDEFVAHMKMLNIITPNHLVKATEHIIDQVNLIKKLEEKGFTYKISDGIYFDILKYESLGNKYGELSTLDEIREGVRVEKNPEKRDPRDFALWKFSPKGLRRDMEWDSPWGVGFPGWHIECSAMSMKYLGDRFDVHIGGEDLRSTHHPNEIVQSEGATGKKPFVKYWIHGAFLLVDGGRMGKSLGNAYTLEDVKARGYDLMALRYFYMTGHYRKQLNFSWEALDSAYVALEKLRATYWQARQDKGRSMLSEEKIEKVDEYRADFVSALEDDLNLPQLLSVVWGVVKSNIPAYDKQDLLSEFDRVLGLNLALWEPEEKVVSDEIAALLNERDVLRKSGKYMEADIIRDRLKKMGHEVVDTAQGSRVA